MNVGLVIGLAIGVGVGHVQIRATRKQVRIEHAGLGIQVAGSTEGPIDETPLTIWESLYFESATKLE